MTLREALAHVPLRLVEVASFFLRRAPQPQRQRQRQRHTASALVISIQPSRNIHAEHSQHESSREHVQIVQSGIAYQPEYSVEDGENNNDGNSIASDCTHGQPAFHFRPSVGIPPVERHSTVAGRGRTLSTNERARLSHDARA